MDFVTSKRMIQEILRDITLSNGTAAIDRFNGLRDVDAKVREVKMILSELPSSAGNILNKMENDMDFEANSRRVRLEALANYCKTALKFLDNGMMQKKKVLVNAPNLSSLTSHMPNLEDVIRDRWLEAQKCQHAHAYLASVVMMGSILEALLLARASLSQPEAFRSASAPRRKDNTNVPINSWTLNTLIDVAVDLKWLKIDRGKFGHALRESRNIVHPWAHVSTGADFDEATCITCWHVLNASVEDLLNSTTQTL